MDSSIGWKPCLMKQRSLVQISHSPLGDGGLFFFFDMFTQEEGERIRISDLRFMRRSP
jgi:hypothetical protein